MATVLTQSYPHSGGYPEIADRDDAGTSTGMTLNSGLVAAVRMRLIFISSTTS